MDVAPHGERPQHLEVAGREPGQPEQRYPLGQLDERFVQRQSFARAATPLSGPRQADPRPRTSPQLWLPQGPGVQGLPSIIVVEAFSPGAEHPGTVKGVAVIEPREMADDAEAARMAKHVLRSRRAADIRGQARQPLVANRL